MVKLDRFDQDPSAVEIETIRDSGMLTSLGGIG